MKQRILAIVLLLALCLCLTTAVFAETDGDTYAIPPLIDDADILTDSEERLLAAKLQQLGETYDYDVVVITTSTLDGYPAAADLSEALFENLHYRENCVMLLVSMDERDWDIGAYGEAEKIFNSETREYIGEKVKAKLSEGDYAGAFSKFSDLCGERLKAGKPYKAPMPWYSIFVALAIGIIVALCVTLTLKGQLKTVARKAAAADYVRAGSLKLRDSRDIFLYHTVTRTAKPKENSSSRSSGSSGGHTSGKF